jgi:hypothetical protein
VWSVCERSSHLYATHYRQHDTHILRHRMKKAAVWNVGIKSFHNFGKWLLPGRLLEEPQMVRLSLAQTEIDN